MSEPSPSASIKEALRTALEQIEAGILPSQLLQRAHKAAEEGDSREFVLVLSEVFDSPDLPEKLESSEFTELADLARRLELEEVGLKILQLGADLHRGDPILKWELLRFMGLSSLRSIREAARESLEAILGIRRNGEITFPNPQQLKDNSRHFGLLMDLLMRDERTEVALEVAEAAQKAAPEEPVVLRNYGRALQAANRGEAAVAVLREATWLPGATDLEPNFLATALANLDDQRGALEADLLACTRDPDDGKNFIRSCIALTLAADEASLEQDLRDALYRPEVASRMILDALSCKLLSSNDRMMASTLIRGFELANEPIFIDPAVRDIAESPDERGRVSVEARRADAERWYGLAKTELTAPPSRKVG